MPKKLIIWDFDGVIADTESLWLYNRMITLNETFGLNWDIKKTNEVLCGMSDMDKRAVLDNMGIITDDAFWVKNKKMDYEAMFSKGFKTTDGIEDILKLNIKQCIATGGLKEKTAIKIKTVGLENYFTPNKVFTVDMVERGKPEPDLFLFAAQQMSEKPEDSIVVEDSLAGLSAAIKAGCLPIAFTGHALNKSPSFTKQIKSLGVKYIFDDMKKLKIFVKSLI